MKDSLPSHVLNDKLPRFLQKCTEKFESDRRYRDDLRYLRVWLQLVTCLSIWVISISNFELEVRAGGVFVGALV